MFKSKFQKLISSILRNGDIIRLLIPSKILKKYKLGGKSNNIREILSGSAIAFVFKGFRFMLGYILYFIISKNYASEGVGYYSLSISILMFLEFVAKLGLHTAALQLIGKLKGRNSFAKIKDLYKKIIFIAIPISIFISIFLFLFSNNIGAIIFKNITLGFAFKTVAIMLPFVVLNDINVDIIRGLKRIAISEYLRNINSHAIALFLIFGLSIIYASVKVPIAGMAIAVAATAVISTYYIYSLVKSHKLVKSIESKKLIKISLPMMVTSFSFVVMGNIDSILLGVFRSTSAVGLYSIALKVAALVSFILIAVNTIAAPKISELYWSKKAGELKKVVKFSSMIMFLASLPILLILILFPSFVLGIFGAEFIDARAALQILIIGKFISAISGSVGLVLNMTGNQNVFRNIILIAIAVNIALNLFLIPLYGINGAAIATTISIVFWNLASVIEVKKRFGFYSIYIPFLTKM